jgi:hypothetical protein
MKSNKRIVLAFVISFLAGLLLVLLNGRDLVLSLQSAMFFAIIATAIVAILTWGMDIAVKKRYPAWVGFLLALFLNIFGLAILAVLPIKTTAANRTEN